MPIGSQGSRHPHALQGGRDKDADPNQSDGNTHYQDWDGRRIVVDRRVLVRQRWPKESGYYRAETDHEAANCGPALTAGFTYQENRRQDGGDETKTRDDE
jgi:hypothetical protein